MVYGGQGTLKSTRLAEVLRDSDVPRLPRTLAIQQNVWSVLMARASNEARQISYAHSRLALVFQEKWYNERILRWYNERESMSSVINMFDGILRIIGRIDVQLARASVRIHRNTKLRRPEVDKHSSRRDVLRRLKHQVDSACQLADLADIENNANADERTALNTVLLELTHLLEETCPLEEPTIESH